MRMQTSKLRSEITPFRRIITKKLVISGADNTRRPPTLAIRYVVQW